MRALRRLVREWPLALVLLAVTAGVVIVRFSHWRKGLLVIGLSVGLAAVLRLLLPAHRAGLLAARSRGRDVGVLGVLGVAISVLAFVIPRVPPPP